MDYGKVARILSFIWLEAQQLENAEYLPSDFWQEYEDELLLANFVTAGWVELKEDGKARIEVAWDTLCEIRELDPSVMYKDIEAFFEAQAVEAEVVPIEKGRK